MPVLKLLKVVKQVGFAVVAKEVETAAQSAKH